MGDIERWVLPGLLVLEAAYVFALAVGWVSVSGVRDRDEARRSRVVLGWSALLTAVLLAFVQRDLLTWIPAAVVVGCAVVIIGTARSRSATDRLRAVPDVDVATVARQFAFDSRPLARGPIEIRMKRRWTTFAAAATVGFSVILVVIAVETVTDPAPDVADWLFLIGATVFFTVVLIAPAAWWVLRVLRGIPMVRLDARGIVMGRDVERDLAIGWDEIEAVDARVIKSSGMTDQVIRFHPADPGWLRRQPWLWRMYGYLNRAMYGSPFAVSTMALDVTPAEILARVRAFRPALMERGESVVHGSRTEVDG